MTAHPPGVTHFSDDQLVDLVNGLLEADERAQVLAHAAYCTVCESRLREAVAVHERGAVAAAAHAASAAKPATVMVLPVRPARHVAALRWAAAAAVVVISAWFISERPPAHESITSRAELVWLPSAPARGGVLRAGSDDEVARLEAGVAAYERRDLARADSLLTPGFESGSLEWVRRLYRASTLVALKRPADAVRSVATTTDDERQADIIPEPWRGELQWTLMVALSQSGQLARADSLAQLLLKRDDAIGERARELRGSRPPR